MGVLERQTLREDVANRRLGRRRLARRQRELSMRRRARSKGEERRRPERGLAQDTTLDLTARRRRRVAVRLLELAELGARNLLILLLFPITVLPVLLRPAELIRRMREAPSRMRSNSRRLRMASRDPETVPGRLLQGLRLTAHFMREEWADMQDGVPSPKEVAETTMHGMDGALRRLWALLGLSQQTEADEPVGERLLRASALGLIVGTVVIGLFISTFQGVEALKSSGRLAVAEITVLGLDRTTRDEVLQSLDAGVGANLLQLDLPSLVGSVRSLPWVDEISVSRDLREQTLEFRVVEYRPMMLLVDDGLHLVGDRGEVFKPLGSGDPSDFPILTMEDAREPAQRAEVVAGALTILRALSAGRAIESSAVSEIRYRQEGGFELITRAGLPVRLGHEGFASRLSRLERAVQEGALPLEAMASLDLGLRDRLVAVPLQTKRARRTVRKTVKEQPVNSKERLRMLHLRRVLASGNEGGGFAL